MAASFNDLLARLHMVSHVDVVDLVEFPEILSPVARQRQARPDRPRSCRRHGHKGDPLPWAWHYAHLGGRWLPRVCPCQSWKQSDSIPSACFLWVPTFFFTKLSHSMSSACCALGLALISFFPTGRATRVLMVLSPVWISSLTHLTRCFCGFIWQTGIAGMKSKAMRSSTSFGVHFKTPKLGNDFTRLDRLARFFSFSSSAKFYSSVPLL